MEKTVKKIDRKELFPAVREYEEEFKKGYEAFIKGLLLPEILNEMNNKIKGK